jgi:hypothetical protein
LKPAGATALAARRLALTTLVLLAAAGSAAAAASWAPVASAALQDRLCPLAAAAAAPEPTLLAGCAQAHCTAVGGDTLCVRRAGRGHRYERRRGAAVLQSWRTEVSPMTGPAAFTVTLADVDGDGRPEWLVARLQGVSNGLGVSSHTLCTVWPHAPRRAPVCREVGEWQSLTVLVHEPGRASCSLMDGRWSPGIEPGRGAGTYAVGRLLRLEGGRWKAVAARQRPPVSRRLLQAFMDERDALPQLNAQRLWYQHPSASVPGLQRRSGSTPPRISP